MTSRFVDYGSEDLFNLKMKGYKLVDHDKYNNENINKFATITDLKNSYTFLVENISLISDVTAQYLYSLLDDLEKKNDFVGVNLLSKQYMILKCINKFKEQLLNPQEAAQKFFERYEQIL
ncbi:unnamed protein product [Adineta steineri]|uniref:Uncharacterized protein n=1 Tax=Adineta steineri TaxID=433720 RepID=A0A819YMT1_9BILA|nr:unnamed protein product [Adineta steineri]